MPEGSARIMLRGGLVQNTNHVIFMKDKNGKRAVYNYNDKIQSDPHFNEYILFHEYFHGDNGRGVGASHQTGWTGLIANLISFIAKEENTGKENKKVIEEMVMN